VSDNTLQHPATLCNTLQHPATPCNTLKHPATHPATLCNTLQHPATPCNTLQHTLQHIPARPPHQGMLKIVEETFMNFFAESLNSFDVGASHDHCA